LFNKRALKGRHSERTSRPFRAFVYDRWIPWASPWTVIACPVGAHSTWRERRHGITIVPLGSGCPRLDSPALPVSSGRARQRHGKRAGQGRNGARMADSSRLRLPLFNESDRARQAGLELAEGKGCRHTQTQCATRQVFKLAERLRARARRRCWQSTANEKRGTWVRTRCVTGNRQTL